MKTLVIIVLVLLVLGLYFYTDVTRALINFTGGFISDRISDVKGLFN
ncbi:MAG: hypothetical protein Q8Q42_03070 [Nanoarchaeota archaeon]|nr:hypothetical protein [Nanoarchaeota archaeon]